MRTVFIILWCGICKRLAELLFIQGFTINKIPFERGPRGEMEIL